VFTVEERDRVRALLVERAQADPRITAGAAVGGLAAGAGNLAAPLQEQLSELAHG
jgi:fermentation-respiration switch protein FrsA (DUF1100 family)